MPAADLTELVRELRARAELGSEADWLCAKPAAASAAVAAAAPVAAAPVPPPAPAAAQAAKKVAPLSLDREEERTPVSVEAELKNLCAQVEACRKCPLGSQRLHPAFGVGASNADVMFIGEGPGFEEDRQGEPFVGKAGQLLDKILASVGLSRQTVYIANVVKCHPMIDPSDPEKRGNDRPPSPEELDACRGYLEAQIRLVRPRFIVALGGVAAKALLRTEDGIMRLRGRWHEYEPGGGLAAIPLMPTFHPAALLRNEDWKRDVWTDMKNLKKAMENES